jgi:transposase
MDKGYDIDALRAYLNQLGGIAVIAANASRLIKPAFDQHLYRERRRIKKLFSKIKHYRRIYARYSSFSSMLSLACILIWLQV